MALLILLALIVVITAVVYYFLKPLQVFSNKQFLISHGFIVVGLGFICGWLWLNQGQLQQITMLLGGIWTLAGGLCFVTGFALRRKIKG
jgi:hypothetical protein